MPRFCTANAVWGTARSVLLRADMRRVKVPSVTVVFFGTKNANLARVQVCPPQRPRARKCHSLSHQAPTVVGPAAVKGAGGRGNGACLGRANTIQYTDFDARLGKEHFPAPPTLSHVCVYLVSYAPTAPPLSPHAVMSATHPAATPAMLEENSVGAAPATRAVIPSARDVQAAVGAVLFRLAERRGRE